VSCREQLLSSEGYQIVSVVRRIVIIETAGLTVHPRSIVPFPDFLQTRPPEFVQLSADAISSGLDEDR
jgi:hypothetical protein